MEKRIADNNISLIRIVVTGPECTGKTTLSSQLAKHYQTVYIPEYAREYIENLTRPYTYEDVVHIALKQREEDLEYQQQANGIIFYDTWLIITKVWFEVVFKKMPSWLDETLKQKTIHLFLLCDTDIPWVPDRTRENGGIMREKLFQIYRKEIEKYGLPFIIISGTGKERLERSIAAVDSLLKDMK
jgi:NadR type nicotinamide-nucleotide adenylyltransferase